MVLRMGLVEIFFLLFLLVGSLTVFGIMNGIGGDIFLLSFFGMNGVTPFSLFKINAALPPPRLLIPAGLGIPVFDTPHAS